MGKNILPFRNPHTREGKKTVYGTGKVFTWIFARIIHCLHKKVKGILEELFCFSLFHRNFFIKQMVTDFLIRIL